MVKKKIPVPPDHLSDSSRALWREIVPRRARSPERLELLTVALEARDRADAARRLLAEEGLLAAPAEDAQMQHCHPAVRLEREALALFLRCWTVLGLTWSEDLDRGY